MRSLDLLQRLYSLDTLDTRLTTTSSTPARATSTQPNGRLSQDSSKSPRPSKDRDVSGSATASRWGTPEFYFYALVFIVAIPLMFKAVIEVSQPSHPNFQNYEHLLSKGWFPGRKVDNSDAQYASFRDNIPYMALVLVLHPLLRKAYNILAVKSEDTGGQDSKSSLLSQQSRSFADSRFEQRISFDLYFALVFVTALHGVSALKILLILYINFCIAKRLPRSQVPAATWVFNVAILFANELSNGYPLVRLAQLFCWYSPRVIAIAEQLDRVGGIIPRWEVLFKISILRLISFNLDFYWALDQRAGSLIEVGKSISMLEQTDLLKKKQLNPEALSERDRVSVPAALSAFSLRNYLAYNLYSPLYLAGPILTFNDYISQNRYPPSSLQRSRTILYGVRFFLTLLCMELILHFIYVVAISKSDLDWSVYTPFQLSMLGYFNLKVIWLKLLLPWRFFRFWSLMDDIDPPENMVRCMSNNYSASAFWRSWHRSYNRWVVRYLFVPLGGGFGRGISIPRASINMLVVFSFVAIWHDIQLRLLIWGWMITLLVLPEVLATIAFPQRKWKDRPDTYRVLCGIGAVFNILFMMISNLVGFAIGLDGINGLVKGMVGTKEGAFFFTLACGALFVGVQVMFEIRENEMRRGIKLNC